MYRLAWLACACALVACTGPAGPPGRNGEDGEDGRDGDAGPPGPPGEPGERGPRGVQGVMGIQGMTGEPGLMGPSGSESYRPAYWFACTAPMDLVGPGPGGVSTIAPDGINESRFVYIVLAYTNGDLDVSCSGSVGSAESASNSFYFPSVVPGAMLAGCGYALDYPPYATGPGGFVGSWAYSITSGTPGFTYMDSDSGHPLNGDSFVFLETECNVLIADENSQWHDAMLADVLN